MAAAAFFSGLLDLFRFAGRSPFGTLMPELPSRHDDAADAARARRDFILEMMDLHPGAFETDDAFRAAMHYFSRRL